MPGGICNGSIYWTGSDENKRDKGTQYAPGTFDTYNICFDILNKKRTDFKGSFLFRGAESAEGRRSAP